MPQEQSVPAVEPEKDSSESQGVQGGREEATQSLSMRGATTKRKEQGGCLDGAFVLEGFLMDKSI